MDGHLAQMEIGDLLAECEVVRQRRSGPGGQHRNKVETAIRIRHLPTGIEAMASESRRQEVNRQRAIQRLRVLLAVRHRRTAAFQALDAVAYQVPAVVAGRIRSGKLPVNGEHADFPAILAELLDLTVVWARGDVARVGVVLEVSPSQIVKILKQVPEALREVNDVRRVQGLHALR